MIDDAKLIEDGTCLHADICVIGGGAAGISLALEFLWQDRSVLVVESGAFASDEETQSLYEGEVVDEALHSPLHTYRQRRFGGSTTIWGGRCVPLDPIDFEQRPYMPASGWPFGYETLAALLPPRQRAVRGGRVRILGPLGVPAGNAPDHRRFCQRQDHDRYARALQLPHRFRPTIRASAHGQSQRARAAQCQLHRDPPVCRWRPRREHRRPNIDRSTFFDRRFLCGAGDGRPRGAAPPARLARSS